MVEEALGIGVFARMRARPGQRRELLAALQPFIASGGGEPGTLIYLVHESIDDPDAVWFYARFRDDEALEVHQANEGALADAFHEVGEHLAEPPQIEYGTVRSDKNAPPHH